MLCVSVALRTPKVAGMLPTLQHLRQFQEIPEVSENIEADVTEIWLHLEISLCRLWMGEKSPKRTGHLVGCLQGGKHHQLTVLQSLEERSSADVFNDLFL